MDAKEWLDTRLHPDNVGSEEYRVIYEQLEAVASDAEVLHKERLMSAILKEFISTAQMLRKSLQAEVRKGD